MADRELRRMHRAELIEIIYALKQSEDQLKAQNAALTAQLQDRQLRLESAGSIAQAALELNNVFAAAQAAAKGWPGMAPQNAPMRAVSIQPLPVTRDMVAQPLWSRMVSLPSVSTSMGPETATTAPVCTASALAEATVRGRVFSVIWSASLTSTPLPAAGSVTTLRVVWIEIWTSSNLRQNIMSPPCGWCGLKFLE